MKKIIIFAVIIIVVTLCFIFFGPKEHPKKSEAKTNGLIMLIEFEKSDGLLQWEKELDKRGLTALVSIQENVLKEETGRGNPRKRPEFTPV